MPRNYPSYYRLFYFLHKKNKIGKTKKNFQKFKTTFFFNQIQNLRLIEKKLKFKLNYIYWANKNFRKDEESEREW